MKRTLVMLVVVAGCSAVEPEPDKSNTSNTGNTNMANPQPIPVPGAPDPERIFLSHETSDDEIFAAGAPESAEPEVEIWIENIARAERFSAIVTGSGSFLVTIKWAAEEGLQCWTQREGKRSEKVELLLPDEPSVIPPSIPLQIDSISAPADGKTTISGTIDGDSTLIVANRETGETVTSSYDQSTAFTVAIAASNGDRLLLFSVDSRTRGRKAMYEKTVPQP